MNKLPLDIVSQPIARTPKKPIGAIRSTPRYDVQVFRSVQKNVHMIIGERVIFDHRKPASNVFEVADIGYRGVSSKNFIPVQNRASEKGVLRHYKRPVFVGMTGYCIPPFFDS